MWQTCVPLDDVRDAATASRQPTGTRGRLTEFYTFIRQGQPFGSGIPSFGLPPASEARFALSGVYRPKSSARSRAFAWSCSDVPSSVRLVHQLHRALFGMSALCKGS